MIDSPKANLEVQKERYYLQYLYFEVLCGLTVAILVLPAATRVWRLPCTTSISRPCKPVKLCLAS